MSSSICFAQYVFLVLISKFSFHSLWGKSWRNAIFKENEIVGRELVCCRFHVLLSHGWIVIQYVSSFQILYWCDYGGQIHIITYQLLMKVSLHKKTWVSNFFFLGVGEEGKLLQMSSHNYLCFFKSTHNLLFQLLMAINYFYSTISTHPAPEVERQ